MQLVKVFALLCIHFLVGCDSSGAFDGNKSTGISDVPKEEPEIELLDISYERGALVPSVICHLCDESLFQYEWSIDSEVVGTDDYYTLADDVKTGLVKLEVIGQDKYGQVTSAYSVYRVSIVTHIYSTHSAFAAVKKDGKVVTWGDQYWGGDSSVVDLTKGVKAVYSNDYSFVLIGNDDSVVSWGSASLGGDSSKVNFSGGVREIYSGPRMYAALKNDGSVVTWGYQPWGGDSSGIDLSNIQKIYSNDNSFVAIKQDGSVIAWGVPEWGGDVSGVDFGEGVEEVYSNARSYVAIKRDGTVVTWGEPTHADVSLVDFSGGIHAVYSTYSAYAAIKNDGSVVTWGVKGGDSNTVSFELEPLIELVETSL